MTQCNMNINKKEDCYTLKKQHIARNKIFTHVPLLY